MDVQDTTKNEGCVLRRLRICVCFGLTRRKHEEIGSMFVSVTLLGVELMSWL